MASWAYWQFKTYKDLTTTAGERSEGFYNKDGTLQTKKIKSLTRTYIQYAQGLIKDMHFDANTGDFNAVIKIDTSIEAPTVVYMHKDDENSETAWYPQGYDWTVEAYDKEGPKPEIDIVETGKNYGSFVIKNQEFNGQLVTLKVTAKKSTDDSSAEDSSNHLYQN